MSGIDSLLVMWIVVTIGLSTVCLGVPLLIIAIIKLIREKKYVVATLMAPVYLLITFVIALIAWLIF